jgi:hypothetical protein
MKYLICLLFLTGCTVDDCHKYPTKAFSYKDSVKVVEGFYKGQVGIVIGQAPITVKYKGAWCNVPGYTVTIDSFFDIFTSDQLREL